MSEIAACTLIQEEPDRKTERYMMMFKDYPDVVSVDILQEMLGICRKNAYLLVKRHFCQRMTIDSWDNKYSQHNEDDNN